MQWVEVKIRTASAGMDLLCAQLTAADFDSFVVDDCAQFEEFLEQSQEYWDYVDETLAKEMENLSQVRLYLEEPTAPADLNRLRELLDLLPRRFPNCDFGPLTLSLEALPEEDWANSWKRHYQPLPVGDRLLVVPRWMTVEDTQGRLPVILDLGLTFGTGAHDSTQMCMRALEHLVKGGERVADLGSGSGILSVCALRLGADSAVGIDIDPAAEHIARANALENGFDESRFSACTGDVIADKATMERLSEGGYDIVCANIVAGVIVRLLPVVPHFLRPSATFLCSGILREREQEVREAMAAAGLQVVGCERTEEWCCLMGRKENHAAI